jgi:hypothetical protein
MISQVFGEWMRKTILAWITISVLALAACQKKMPAPELEVLAPTPVEGIPVSQKIEPQENYCLSCHSDKEQLIATAKPEEMVEAESSGAG